MASGRRGNSADLREALMALVKTTLDQVGAVRDVALKQAQNQRAFLDQALMGKKRKDALAALGEEVYSRMLGGELAELTESPAIAELVSEVAELDAAMEEATQSADDKPADWGKSRARHGTRRPGGARVWRPGSGSAATDTDEANDQPKRRRRRAAPAERRGGITFVAETQSGGENDDLAEYMNDDDVPTDAD
ncbi:MAG: hypothetical protein KJO07_12090 [Deltaproteobacteria bacterium]|nr:hypothetical protein [Deltaproteobacteria bacterium]